MILSNLEIQRALDEGRLIIDPEPLPREQVPGGEECPYDTHSVNLKLHHEISIPQSGPFAYDLMTPGSVSNVIHIHCERISLKQDQPYALEPNKFILAMTHETIGLPIDKGPPYLAARIEGKSSRARCGVLVHCTAPIIHPNWHGQLTLEMINLGPVTFLLRPKMLISQLIVEEVRGEVMLNPSQFQNQSTPEGLP